MTSQAARRADSDIELHCFPSRSSSDWGYTLHGAPTESRAHLQQDEHHYQKVNGQSQQYDQGDVTVKSRHGQWRIWLWEILSCLTSIGCIAALAAVLLAFNHHALPSWPLGITLNTLISVLAVFAKASTLVVVASCLSQLKWHWFGISRRLLDFEIFDQASRGPVGSILLLFRIRSVHLAAIGALLTVLAVAVDPFVQQIIGYEQHQVLVSNNAYAYRAQLYDSDVFYDPSAGFQEGPEAGVKAAVYTGLFGTPDVTGPTPKCSTGNCTIPAFASLAVCSKCANVTDQIIKLSTTRLKPDGFGGFFYNITYTLPGNVLMNLTYDAIPGDGLQQGIAMTSRTDHSNEMTRSLFDVSNAVTAVSILQFPTVDADGYGGNYTTAHPFAWECALYFCVNTYEVNVSFGVPSTRLLSSWHDSSAPPVDDSKYDPLNAMDRNNLTTLKIPPSLMPELNFTASRDNSFSITAATLFALSEYLNYTLACALPTRTSILPSTYANDVAAVLNSTVDLGTLFDNVAVSMTNYIRSGVPFNPAVATASGAAYTNQTFVHVRWAWIILPVTVVLLAAAFLIATVLVSVRERVWKESGLAVMFRGVDGRGESLLQMRESAEGRSAVMGEDKNGQWRLMDHAS